MLQIHETMHRYQVGEPLLNEAVQAALRSRLLSQESRWSFQRDERRSLVREAAVVNEYPMLAEAAIAAGLDTATAIDGIAAGNAYLACCLLARTASIMASCATAITSPGSATCWRSAPTPRPSAVSLSLL